MSATSSEATSSSSGDETSHSSEGEDGIVTSTEVSIRSKTRDEGIFAASIPALETNAASYWLKQDVATNSRIPRLKKAALTMIDQGKHYKFRGKTQLCDPVVFKCQSIKPTRPFFKQTIFKLGEICSLLADCACASHFLRYMSSRH